MFSRARGVESHGKYRLLLELDVRIIKFRKLWIGLTSQGHSVVVCEEVPADGKVWNFEKRHQRIGL